MWEIILITFQQRELLTLSLKSFKNKQLFILLLKIYVFKKTIKRTTDSELCHGGLEGLNHVSGLSAFSLIFQVFSTHLELFGHLVFCCCTERSIRSLSRS